MTTCLRCHRAIVLVAPGEVDAWGAAPDVADNGACSHRWPDPSELQRVADFDHPFRVTESGQLADDVAGVHAPDVHYDEADEMTLDGAPYREASGWEALTGYTGQHGYRGPVMHASEFLGGGIADDILSTPGVYVVTSVEVWPEDEEADYDPEPAGWAVLRLSHADYPHEPGRLYDCPACEATCHCDPVAVTEGREEECVYSGTHRTPEGA